MSDNYFPLKKKTIRTIIVVNSFLFISFSFIYLSFFQGLLLEKKIEEFTDRQFNYNIWLGAITLTVLLKGLQLIISKFLPTRNKWNAFTYLPSFLILGILTYYKESYIPFFMLFLLVILLLLMLSSAKRNKRRILQDDKAFKFHLINLNILEILILCVLTVSIGNTNENLHYELAVEKLIRKGNYAKALLIGKKTLKPSKRLTILRNFAMSKNGDMGERLFTFPQKYGTDGLLPLSCQNDSSDNWTPENKDDYYIASLLLKKDLKALKESYDNKSKDLQVPRYYAEALILYSALNPEEEIIINNHANLKQEFSKFQEQKKQYNSFEEEKNYMRRQFAESYWWYYYYQ